MIEYFQDLIDVAFDFENTSRGARKMAFAQLMISGILVVGVPFKILMFIGDRIRARRAEASLYQDVSQRLPEDARPGLARELVESEQLKSRFSHRYVPPPPLKLAPRPTDGRYFETLRAFAEEKKRTGEVMNEYERETVGVMGFLYEVFGLNGLAHFDSFGGIVPFRSHELCGALERLGLSELTTTIESALEVHLKRYQLGQDYMATGMPAEQVASHPNMPTYEQLDVSLNVQGGSERFIRAANRYLEAAYPWEPAQSCPSAPDARNDLRNESAAIDPYSAIDKQSVVPAARPELSADEEITLVVGSAKRPLDKNYWEALLRHCQAKNRCGAKMTPDEELVVGRLAFAERLLREPGCRLLDTYRDGLPYTGAELARAFRMVDLPELGETLAVAVQVYDQRRSVRGSLLQQGVAPSIVETHKEIPTYDSVDYDLMIAGGHGRFIWIVNRYFEHAYEWVSDGDTAKFPNSLI